MTKKKTKPKPKNGIKSGLNLAAIGIRWGT